MSDSAFNIGEYARQLVEGYGRIAEVSAGLTEERYHRAISALDAAYRKAALDPQTKIPSYMEAAVYVLVAMLPQTSAAQIDESVCEHNYLARHCDICRALTGA